MTGTGRAVLCVCPVLHMPIGALLGARIQDTALLEGQERVPMVCQGHIFVEVVVQPGKHLVHVVIAVVIIIVVVVITFVVVVIVITSDAVPVVIAVVISVLGDTVCCSLCVCRAVVSSTQHVANVCVPEFNEKDHQLYTRQNRSTHPK